MNREARVPMLCDTPLGERLTGHALALEAHRYQEVLERCGVASDVRQWHKGERGWWVVARDSYERLEVPLIRRDAAVSADVVGLLTRKFGGSGVSIHP